MVRGPRKHALCLSVSDIPVSICPGQFSTPELAERGPHWILIVGNYYSCCFRAFQENISKRTKGFPGSRMKIWSGRDAIKIKEENERYARRSKKAEVNIHSTPRIPLVLDYKPRFTWARGRKPPVRLSIWYASGEIRSGWRWLHKTGHYIARF